MKITKLSLVCWQWAQKKICQSTSTMGMHAQSCQLCPTLCDPMDCSPPSSSAHGISQARILEWVAISSSKGSFWSRDRTCVSYVSCNAGGYFTAEPPAKPTSTTAWTKHVLWPRMSGEAPSGQGQLSPLWCAPPSPLWWHSAAAFWAVCHPQPLGDCAGTAWSGRQRYFGPWVSDASAARTERTTNC